MKTCQDIMTTELKCATLQQRVSEIAQMMKEEDVGAIPVVDDVESRKLVGILTDRDIVLKVVAECQDAQSVHADAVMTSDLVFCHPGDALEQARDAMQVHQIRRLPVVDQEQKLVGIISQKDVAERAKDEEAGELVKEISRG